MQVIWLAIVILIAEKPGLTTSRDFNFNYGRYITTVPRPAKG